MADPGSDEGLSRRDLLKKAGLGGAVLLGGSLVGAATREEAQASTAGDVYADGHGGQMTLGEDVLSTIYGHGAGPPRGIDPASLDAQTIPPPPDRRPALCASWSFGSRSS